MNKNLQSPTKLTEFAPLQPEERQQSVGQFISRFFKLGRSSPGEEQSLAVSESVSDVSQEILPTWAADTSVEGSEKTRNEAYYEVDVTEGRSLPNVLKRISNLLVLKSTVSSIVLVLSCCLFFNSRPLPSAKKINPIIMCLLQYFYTYNSTHQ